jgi:hypothetical protein
MSHKPQGANSKQQTAKKRDGERRGQDEAKENEIALVFVFH